MKIQNSILLVGSGYMATEYAKVLQGMRRNFVVVGRSQKSVDNFKKITGVSAIAGGINNWLKENNKVFSEAIIAVSEDKLKEVTMNLIKAGCNKILTEKPGGLNMDEIIFMGNQIKKIKAQVFVAYNRRFYASVIKAGTIIKEDGGISSFNFEFTERSDIVKNLKKPKEIKRNWFFLNSTHVIDLAFFIGGKPQEIKTYKKGSLSWHPNGSIFVGCGKSERGALFSYHANWESPGRWGIEFCTKKHRLIFRPLEKLQIQKIGQFEIFPVEIDDKLDTKYKAGLYLQTKAFLNSENKNLCSLAEHVNNLKIYKKICRES